MTNPFGGGPKKGATATKAAPSTPPRKAAPPAPAAKAAPAKAAPVKDDDQEPTTLAPSKDPFAQPSGPSEYKFTEFVGEVLLVKPYEEGVMKTKISDQTPVIRADVVRLSNENERVDDMLIFQEALMRTFRKVLNGPNNWTIGELQMGEAKNGRSAPYIFVRVDEETQAHGLAVAKELELDL